MIRVSELLGTIKCSKGYMVALVDTLNVLNGKWKLPIISVLSFEKKRFSEIEKGIPKITPRMLSKELKDLEINGIVKRTILNTMPVTVEYELTPSGKTFRQVLDIMVAWGLQHREMAINTNL